MRNLARPDTESQSSMKAVLSRYSYLKPKQLPTLILLVLGLAYFAAYIFIYGRYASDDSYIHLRIARNFAEHGVPYYNPDQAVAGSSSLFWLILLSGLFKLFPQTLGFLPYVTFAFTAGSFFMAFRILSVRYPKNTAIALAFLVTVTTLVNVAALFMETPAAIFFWAVSVYFWQKNSFSWFGFFSGMAFLSRYEFAVWILLGIVMMADRVSVFRYIKGSIIPGAFYILFNLYFFNSLFPQTIVAKSKIYSLSISLFIVSLRTTELLFTLGAIAISAILFLAFKQKSPPWIKATIVFPALLLTLYTLRTVLMFNWYQPNIFFPLSLACLLIIRKRQLFLLLALITAFPLVFIKPLIEGYGLASGKLNLYRDYDTGRRVHQYLNIGAELAAQYPNSVLMTSEIGGLGWSFPGKIIDAVGLVSPESLKYHPMPVPEDRSNGASGSIPPQAVRDLQPDLVVSMETFSEALRRDLARGSLVNYKLLQSYPVLAPEAYSAESMLWGSSLTQIFINTASPTVRSVPQPR